MSWFNRNFIWSKAINLSCHTRIGTKKIIRFWKLANWLSEQTSQVLNEIVEHVRANYPPRQSLEIGESDSALREFTRVYTINGIEGYDARRFLQDARQNITSVLKNNRKTNVKLILKCNTLEQLYNHLLFIPILRSI